MLNDCHLLCKWWQTLKLHVFVSTKVFDNTLLVNFFFARCLLFVVRCANFFLFILFIAANKRRAKRNKCGYFSLVNDLRISVDTFTPRKPKNGKNKNATINEKCKHICFCFVSFRWLCQGTRQFLWIRRHFSTILLIFVSFYGYANEIVIFSFWFLLFVSIFPFFFYFWSSSLCFVFDTRVAFNIFMKCVRECRWMHARDKRNENEMISFALFWLFGIVFEVQRC